MSIAQKTAAILENIKLKKEVDYWKKRCEAAEEVIDRFGEPPHEMASEMGKRIYREWQSLKSAK